MALEKGSMVMNKRRWVIRAFHSFFTAVWEHIGSILVGILITAAAGGLILFVVWAVTSQTNQAQSDCDRAKATVHLIARNDPQDLNKVTDMMVLICND